jgi:glycosidase
VRCTRHPRCCGAGTKCRSATKKSLPGTQITRHELDFWGGDLQSLATRLDHVQRLGADVLYLNPIHLGFTNHKYDSLDFQAVSPEYGTRADVKALAADCTAAR